MHDEFNRSGDATIEEKSPDRDDILVSKMSNEGGRPQPDFDLASSVKEVAQRTGDVLKGATESISKAIESALSARDHVVMVRVNDESLKKLDSLVQSGIFKSRSEAAAFLISEGIKAQDSLFRRISEKISEIERLRSELRSSITPQGTES
jgi:Arc/MetJ-type ribon-helix-helix transcriptional regulator